MPDQGVLLSEQLALDLRELLEQSRRNPPPNRPPPGNWQGPRPSLRAYLLQDLPSPGSVPCEVSQPCVNTMVQKVAIIGMASGGTFKLSFQLPAPQGQSQPPAQTTAAIAWNATAAQMQSALQALSNIGRNNVIVTLGKIPAAPAVPATASRAAVPARPAMFPGLWLVEFVGSFQAASNSPPPTTAQLPLLTVAANSLTGGPSFINIVNEGYRDGGSRETAVAVIPVGTPTPMRAGSVVGCVWYPGLGYGVHACECREFVTSGF